MGSQAEDVLGGRKFVLWPEDTGDSEEIIQSLVYISATHVEGGSPPHLKDTGFLWSIERREVVTFSKRSHSEKSSVRVSLTTSSLVLAAITFSSAATKQSTARSKYLTASSTEPAESRQIFDTWM